MHGPDLYTVLNLHSNANEREIRTAYLNLSRTCHPDKCRTEKGDERFLRIQKAYRILSDALLRRYYDMYGEHDIDIAETVRAKQTFPLVDIVDPHFNKVFHKFGKTVRKTKTLRNELQAYKRSNHSSSIAIKLLYPYANPFIPNEYNKSLPFHNVILSSVSLTQKKNFSFQNSTLNGSISFGIARLGCNRNFLVSSSVKHNPFLHAKWISPATLSFHVAYRLSRTMDTSLFLDSQGTRGSCTAVIKKNVTLSSFVSLTSTIAHEAWKPHQIYDIEYTTEMQSNTFATIKTGVGSSNSNVSFTLHSTNLPFCVFSSVALRIDNSQFQVEWRYVTPFFSCFRPFVKQENKFSESRSCTTESAQVDVYLDYTLNAGLNLNVSYLIPLTIIDPFTKLHYIIRFNLNRGFFCVELRLKRLSANFELPIIMSWKPAENTQIMQHRDISVTSKFSLWVLLWKFGITPILMHRLWVDLLKNNILLKQFDHLFLLLNNEKNRIKKNIITISNTLDFFRTRLMQTLLNVRYLTPTTNKVNKTFPIHTIKNACCSNFFSYFKHGNDPDTFEIILAIYGSLSIFQTYIFCFIEKKYFATWPLLSQFHKASVFQRTQSPVTLLQNFKEYISDVREPLKAFVKDNKLNVPSAKFYYLLPGFKNLDNQKTHNHNMPRVLYIKYRWKKQEHIRFFVDGSNISIP